MGKWKQSSHDLNAQAQLSIQCNDNRTILII